MYEYDYKKYASLYNWLNPNSHDCADFNFYNSQSNKQYRTCYKSQNETMVDGYIVVKNTDIEGDDNGGKPFEYIYNTDGFRSQHFENFKSDDINIVFSGCSWTEGSGLPQDMVWTSLLTEKIKEMHPDENVETYNVGIGGASIPLVFKNTLAFLRKYDKVDYLYMLLPGFDRASSLEYSAHDGVNPGFRKIVYVSPEDKIFKIPTIKKFVLNYEPADAMYTMLPMIKAIEDICALKGIKLYWGTWVTWDQPAYEDFDFYNYVKIPYWDRLSINGAVKDKTYRTIASDGHHPGLDHHIKISDTFYEATVGEI